MGSIADFGASSTGSAAESHARPRPKIGVALEGGGAMGLAHIGVLKWFEETTSRWTTLPGRAWAD